MFDQPSSGLHQPLLQRLGLSALTGKNTQLPLPDLLRQSIYQQTTVGRDARTLEITFKQGLNES
jgi:hypothetical protein